MRPLALTTALVVALLAGPALAGPKLTLNGVPIDGARDQRFENATVVIDAEGDVHVTAKGYAVKGGAPAASGTGAAASPAAAAGAAAPAASSQDPRPTRRYFLATEQSQPDGTQYDVEVFINAHWIRVLRSADPQVVMELTRYLRPGANTITLAATKRLAGVARRSTSREVTLRVVIGEGNVSGDRVTMDAPLVVMTRTAAELDDRTEEFTVEAR
jgi:hypothetical protein